MTNPIYFVIEIEVRGTAPLRDAHTLTFRSVAAELESAREIRDTEIAAWVEEALLESVREAA